MLLFWKSSTPRGTWFAEAPQTRLERHDVGRRRCFYACFQGRLHYSDYSGDNFRACQGAVERSDHHDCIRWLLVADCELGRQQVRILYAKHCWRSSFCSCMVGDLVLLPLLCASIAEKVAETWKLSLHGIFSSSFPPRGVQIVTGPVGAYHDQWWVHDSLCVGLRVASQRCENR